MTEKTTPEPIRLAMAVLDGYLGDPERHARLKPFLPALAMRLARAGQSFDAVALEAHVEQGWDHLQSLAKSLDGRPKEPALSHEALSLRFITPRSDGAWSIVPDALQAAIRAGDLAAVQALEAADPALTQLSAETAKQSPLHIASSHGHVALIRHYAALDPAGLAAEGEALLVETAANGQIEGARLLADLCPQLGELAWHKALRYAAEANRTGFVDWLVDMRPYDSESLLYAAGAALNEGHGPMAGRLLGLRPPLTDEDAAVLALGAARSRRIAAIDAAEALAPGSIDRLLPEIALQAARRGHDDIIDWAIARDDGSRIDLPAAMAAAAEETQLEAIEALARHDARLLLTQGARPLRTLAGYGRSMRLHAELSRFAPEDWSALPLQGIRPAELAALHATGLPESAIPADCREQVLSGADHFRQWLRAGLTPIEAAGLTGYPVRDVSPPAVRKAMEWLRAEDVQPVVLGDYACRLARLFRSEQGMLKVLERHGSAQNPLLHDMASACVMPKQTDGACDLKAWGDAIKSCGFGMAKLLRYADRLPQPVKSPDGRWHLAATQAAVAQFAYSAGERNPALADFCLRHGISDRDFGAALTLIDARTAKAGRRIPDASVDGAAFDKPGYRFRKLPAGDPRGLFLGEITDCCQSIGNVGNDCAVHGFTSADGGFYVVEKIETGDIVAQSWAWRGTRGELVLDSLEALGRDASMTTVQWRKAIDGLAKALAGSDVKALQIGSSGRTPRDGGWEETQPAVPVDYQGYRDSNRQLLAWTAPAPAPSGRKAKPAAARS